VERRSRWGSNGLERIHTDVWPCACYSGITASTMARTCVHKQKASMRAMGERMGRGAHGGGAFILFSAP